MTQHAEPESTERVSVKVSVRTLRIAFAFSALTALAFGGLGVSDWLRSRVASNAPEPRTVAQLSADLAQDERWVTLTDASWVCADAIRPDGSAYEYAPLREGWAVGFPYGGSCDSSGPVTGIVRKTPRFAEVSIDSRPIQFVLWAGDSPRDVGGQIQEDLMFLIAALGAMAVCVRFIRKAKLPRNDVTAPNQ